MTLNCYLILLNSDQNDVKYILDNLTQKAIYYIMQRNTNLEEKGIVKEK